MNLTKCLAIASVIGLPCLASAQGLGASAAQEVASGAMVLCPREPSALRVAPPQIRSDPYDAFRVGTYDQLAREDEALRWGEETQLRRSPFGPTAPFPGLDEDISRLSPNRSIENVPPTGGGSLLGGVTGDVLGGGAGIGVGIRSEIGDSSAFALEEALSSRGLYQGQSGRDGRLDRRDFEAIRELQARQGLVATGCLDQQTLDSLGIGLQIEDLAEGLGADYELRTNPGAEQERR